MLFSTPSPPSLARRKPRSPRLSLLVAALRFVAGAFALGLAGIALVNTIIQARVPTLGPRVGGWFGRYPARYGDIAYVVAGDGPPLVLVHSLDPGQSMATWRAVFEVLADHFTVYAFDWQGFGLSDPNPEGLNAREFGAQLRDFVRDIVDKPCTVIAHGNASSLALEAASKGELIEKLVLVCPTASAPDEPHPVGRAEFLAQREMSGRALALPVIGTAILNWWRSLAHFEREAREFALWDKSRVETEAHLWHTTAHQKGAHRAQKALLEGQFATNWRDLWRANSRPSLLIWGRHARGFESASEWGALRPDAELKVVDNALWLPQLDAPEEFARVVSEWVKELEPKK